MNKRERKKLEKEKKNEETRCRGKKGRGKGKQKQVQHCPSELSSESDTSCFPRWRFWSQLHQVLVNLGVNLSQGKLPQSQMTTLSSPVERLVSMKLRQVLRRQYR